MTAQLATAVATPAALAASTVSACVPRARPLKDTGLEQDTNTAPSRLQRVEVACLALKANDALRAVVGDGGTLVNEMVGLGVFRGFTGFSIGLRAMTARRRPLRPLRATSFTPAVPVPRAAGR